MKDALPDRAWMTPALNRIADAAGERAALILGRERACEKIYIPSPAKLKADHWLAQLIGMEPARALSEKFGGNKLEIPPALAGDKRRRHAALARMIENGYSNNEIARALGVTHKTVQLHRRKVDTGQGDLFKDLDGR